MRLASAHFQFLVFLAFLLSYFGTSGPWEASGGNCTGTGLGSPGVTLNAYAGFPFVVGPAAVPNSGPPAALGPHNPPRNI